MGEEVLGDCVEVDSGAGDDVEVPDGVGERDAAVALEEHNASQVDDAANLQLKDSGSIELKYVVTVLCLNINLLGCGKCRRNCLKSY